MPLLGLGLGLQRPVGSLLDADVQAFGAESGATDLSGLNRLVKYLKAESLYSNFVIYPMKSAQNAGSDLTVYSLGGLTTNNMTLVNSPTWGASGVTLNGTNQYGLISDFNGGGSITMFARKSWSSAISSAVEAIFGQYDTTLNERSVLIQSNGLITGDPYILNRSSDGTGATLEQYESATELRNTDDETLVVEWISGNGRNLYTNKTARSLSLFGGSAQTERFNSSADITLGCFLASGSPVNFAGLLSTAIAVSASDLTTTQRETITDFINAL